MKTTVCHSFESVFTFFFFFIHNELFRRYLNSVLSMNNTKKISCVYVCENKSDGI